MVGAFPEEADDTDGATGDGAPTEMRVGVANSGLIG